MLAHFLKRAQQDDEEAMDTDSDNGEGNRRQEVQEVEANEDDEEPIKSKMVLKLLHLRDVKAREAAFKFDHNDPRAMGELQGLLVALNVSKREADAARDHAVRSEATARAEILQLQNSAEELRIQHEHVVASLKQALNELESRHQLTLDELARKTSALKELESRHQLALDEAATKVIDASSPGNSGQNSSAVASTHTIDLFTKMPGKDNSPEFFARWLQFRKATNINGIPLSGPDWVVDLRNVRGYHQVHSRIPPKGTTKAERKHHGNCLIAILRVLAVPGKYPALLNRLGLTVAETPRLEALPIPIDQPNFDDKRITRVLSEQGLTIAVANDAWQFCRNLVFDLASSQNSIAGEAANVKSLVEAALRDSGMPPPCAIRPAEEDRYLYQVEG
ncbi:hypothetical protein K438DRAFT_1955561 [Mycena galopus ATCC 62051]|nr:hypothetical protein K438DRAFT_1955561 [Mycena galopus ATCC 62051]